MSIDVEVGIHGVRTFLFDPHIGRFHSLAMPGDHWKDGVCEAKCYLSRVGLRSGGARIDGSFAERLLHTAPDFDCRCGIYAALSYNVLHDRYVRWMHSVIAIIAAEGVTIIGDRGFRTERARVVAYHLPSAAFQGASVLERKRAAVAQFKDATHHGSCHRMLDAYGIPHDLNVSPEEVNSEGRFVGYWGSGERVLDE